ALPSLSQCPPADPSVSPLSLSVSASAPQRVHLAGCYFINGTEKVRYVGRFIYNREQFLMFDSDVGLWVGFTFLGDRWAKGYNSDPAELEYRRAAVHWFCRHNYEFFPLFVANLSQSLPSFLVHSPSLPVHSQCLPVPPSVFPIHQVHPSPSQ
uniref:MHC class II beta chain N-terminal domain-containing protein n=1 Tax=Zonotrichia albicollis TaxID=44394 RepID=A0A8D2M0Z8_ZONAL